MAVYLIRPEMTQSRQAFNHELDTKYTTQVPPPADFRPAKPFPTASSTAPSRPSDHLANAVTSNVAAGGRRQHAHYGSGDLEKGSLGLEQYQLEAAKHPQVAEAPAPLRILHHVRTDGRSANGNHTISTYDYEGYEHDGVEGKAMRVLSSNPALPYLDPSSKIVHKPPNIQPADNTTSRPAFAAATSADIFIRSTKRRGL
ncbi:MAG: hypothetical protein M1812_004191 [Candelaria pacifica]|nr:MAG: hypothetical protein M1812_004191 [Candelaria pacifica]